MLAVLPLKNAEPGQNTNVNTLCVLFWQRSSLHRVSIPDCCDADLFLLPWSSFPSNASVFVLRICPFSFSFAPTVSLALSPPPLTNTPCFSVPLILRYLQWRHCLVNAEKAHEFYMALVQFQQLVPEGCAISFQNGRMQKPLGNSLCRTIWDLFCSCDKILKMGKNVYFKLWVENVRFNKKKEREKKSTDDVRYTVRVFWQVLGIWSVSWSLVRLSHIYPVFWPQGWNNMLWCYGVDWKLYHA